MKGRCLGGEHLVSRLICLMLGAIYTIWSNWNYDPSNLGSFELTAYPFPLIICYKSNEEFKRNWLSWNASSFLINWTVGRFIITFRWKWSEWILLSVQVKWAQRFSGKELNVLILFWKKANLPMLKIYQQNAGRLNLDNQDTLLLGNIHESQVQVPTVTFVINRMYRPVINAYVCIN